MNRPWAHIQRIGFGLAFAAIGACGGQTAQPPARTPTTESTLAETFDGTVGVTDVKRETATATLRDVRVASHAHFDRVELSFSAGDTLPGHHIEYIDKPIRDCGEGSTKQVAGDAWLEVRLYPTNAHTEAGQPTIAFREQSVALPVVREIERTCDFEAVTTWVIGVGSPNPYRVQELNDPPRLVIDIAHAPRPH